MDYMRYWLNRTEKLFLEGEKDTFDVIKQMKTQYEEAVKKIEQQLLIFYGRYQSATGISMQELNRRLNKEELLDFKKNVIKLAEYAKEHKFDINYQKNIEALKYLTNISRLKELQTNINFEIEKLTNEIDNQINETLSSTYENGYYKTIFNAQQITGMSTAFTVLNLDAIQKAISTPYMVENYSQVLWRNKESLLNILEKQIPQGIILGYNPKKVAQLASKKLDTNYKATARLVRTEYNLILNDATAEGYAQCDIDKYQLLATLDNRTSEICREMDGKVFELSRKAVGVNYPPFHPNCRTTTIAYFEPDEFDAPAVRLAKDIDGNYYEVPANLTYKEWEAGLTEQANGQMAYTKYKQKEPAIKFEEMTDKQIKRLISQTDKLPAKDLLELKWYTSNGYKQLNSNNPSIQQRIDNFKSILAKGQIGINTVLYRGMKQLPISLLEGFSDTNIKMLQNYSKQDKDIINTLLQGIVGREYTEKGFVSTTIDKKIANKFVDNENGIILNIKVPKETNGFYVDKISTNPDEKEFIVNKGYSYIVKGFKRDKNGRVILNVKRK